MSADFNHFFRYNAQITDASQQNDIDTIGTTDSFHHFISTIEHAIASIHDQSFQCISSMQSCLNNNIETTTLLNYLIDIQSLDDRMDQWSNILLCIKWLISYHEDYNNNKSIKTNYSNIFQIQGIEYKYSLLHIAAALSEVRLLQKVIEFAPKLDINIADDKGWTALHYASSRNHVRCAEILLEYGANLYSMDKVFHTPLHLCGRFKQYRMHHDGVMPLMGFWKDDILRQRKQILELVDEQIKCEDVSMIVVGFLVPDIPRFPTFFSKKNKTHKNMRKVRKKRKIRSDDVIFRIYIG